MLKVADILAPIRVVRIANDDGSNQALITPDQVAQWVHAANRVFGQMSGIGLTFDRARDFETLRGTRLNDFWADSGLEVDRLAAIDADHVALTRPTRVVVIVRRGRQSTPVPPAGCGPGCGASSTGNDILMPDFHQDMVQLLAHELGHYLGLPHTFSLVIDTIRDARAIFEVSGSNRLLFDNDRFHVGDTPRSPSSSSSTRATSPSSCSGGTPSSCCGGTSCPTRGRSRPEHAHHHRPGRPDAADHRRAEGEGRRGERHLAAGAAR
jgi:hypothetical protein